MVLVRSVGLGARRTERKETFLGANRSTIVPSLGLIRHRIVRSRRRAGRGSGGQIVLYSRGSQKYRRWTPVWGLEDANTRPRLFFAPDIFVSRSRYCLRFRDRLGAWFLAPTTSRYQWFDFFFPSALGLPMFTYNIAAGSGIVLREIFNMRPGAYLSYLCGEGGRFHPVYARAPGATARYWGIFHSLRLGLVELPSGQLRVLSSNTLSLAGMSSYQKSPALIHGGPRKRRWFGWKSRVRGVARNPNDHPHGGRTKAIRCPKTPWGLVTKRTRGFVKGRRHKSLGTRLPKIGAPVT